MRRFHSVICQVGACCLVACTSLLGETPAGFTPLFNGKDLAGWKGLVSDPPARARMSREDLARAQEAADQRMREHWKVEDGILVFDGKGENLCSARDYENFELLVDWKIEKNGDSGIYLRGSPQVQIWDHPDGSGGLYNNQKGPSKPLKVADRPVGEWNTFRIRMVGERVSVHLNGDLVVDNVALENYWEPARAIYSTGAIELQNHGNKLYFRNILVREIPAAEVAAGAANVLRRGARVAVVGDSITEQKLYSKFLELYLLVCLPDLDLKVIQLGWGGERAPGFEARMENDLLPWKPDVVTTCYGMNDGSYRKFEPRIGEAYERSLRAIVERLKVAGATVVVGSPGAVDTVTFKMPSVSPADYNVNLSRLRDIARSISAEKGQPFANVHDTMYQAMGKAKAALGDAYDVCGADGFHPQANGHLLMAQAFLEGLGVDGDLGEIVLDLKQGASARGGHSVVSSSGGSATIESSRYPFCFYGDGKAPSSTRSILPHCSFNERLNRFRLVVKGLTSERARVRWGGATKSFARSDLEKGINLAAEFLDNPFSAPFQKVEEVVSRKQGFETPMIKEAITRLRTFRDLVGGADPQAEQAMALLRERLLAKQAELHAAARAAVVPVRHEISVEPE